ncbi:sucrose-6F-phosphate phosphohydrolase [Pararhizobium capsulatum DSM 1112]|uniref:Sucrose-6F-phosphate phosphohydrolase n=1 Tax=Pararhizobium capsulatum DSM 1112 TaxID=1121113 RepID=A0ABU0BQH4_9HYPH|nr:HAD-IIB family hydrolase [Pararhizobium capsulatum]MDQ0320502.1 sucrose-6F-phosphate phosphohydrolase [Pararhizobium capsulatum DSM 1112]
MPIRLLCCDIDGTVTGDAAAEARFRDAWLGLPADKRPLFVVNSGRLIEDQQAFLRTTNLPAPDIMIGGVGTMFWAMDDGGHSEAFSSFVGQVFDTKAIAATLATIKGMERQPARYQHAHKSSWYLRNAEPSTLSDIEALLQDAGHEVRIVYSSARDLDILPQGVDKGAALAWLCKRLDIALKDVVVAGDTGNDLGLFELPDVRGIVVGNALPELKAITAGTPRFYAARQTMADGVLEGLQHFGLVNGYSSGR